MSIKIQCFVEAFETLLNQLSSIEYYDQYVIKVMTHEKPIISSMYQKPILPNNNRREEEREKRIVQ